MLPSVYSEWYAHVTRRKAPPPPAPAGVGRADFDAIIDVAYVPEIVPDLAAEEADEAAAAMTAEAPNDATTDGLSSKGRSRNRFVASNFVASPTLGPISIGIRLICTHVFDRVHSSFEVCGSKWDRLQHARSVKGFSCAYMGICRFHV